MIDGMEERHVGRRLLGFVWGLGKYASWKWSPCTPGSKEGVKGMRRSSGERTGAEETNPIAYLWALIDLKIPLPSSLAHTPENYSPFHHTLDGKFSEAENPWVAWAVTWCLGIYLPGRLTGAELCLLSHLHELQIVSPSLVLPPPPCWRTSLLGWKHAHFLCPLPMPTHVRLFCPFQTSTFFWSLLFCMSLLLSLVNTFLSFWQYSVFALSPVLSLSLCQSLGLSSKLVNSD